MFVLQIKKVKITRISFHLKKLGKKRKYTQRGGRQQQIKAKMEEKSMRTSYVFEKINKIYKSLAKLIKQKEVKYKITNINTERRDITTYITDIKGK